MFITKVILFDKLTKRFFGVNCNFINGNSVAKASVICTYEPAKMTILPDREYAENSRVVVSILTPMRQCVMVTHSMMA